MSAVIKVLAKYGSKAVKFAVAHKNTIIKIIKEISFQAAINWVLKALGLN